MVKSVSQPSENRWIEGFYDKFGAAHAKPVPSIPLEEPKSPQKSKSKLSLHTLSKRSIPSQQVWRSENVFGRIVNFFEQSVFILGKIWPSRSPKIDQRLMASLHGQRIAALHPTLKMAPLSQILKYTTHFLAQQKGETAPPREVLKTLKQTAKWARTLENIGAYSNQAKRQKLLAAFSKKLSNTLHNLPQGTSCVIPGGWKDGLGVHSALYQVKKNASGTYQIKILSRDQAVNPQSVLMSAGKMKIYSETTFNDLTKEEISDPDWLHALLSLQMPSGGVKKASEEKEKKSGKDKLESMISTLLGTRGESEVIPDFTSLSGLFLPFADRIDLSPKPVEKFRTALKSDARAKNLWMLVDILGLESRRKELPGERRKLQLKVNSLFQFFQVIKNDLPNNKTHQILLQEGVLNVGKAASLMHAQGKLTEAEVAVINRELAVIEKSLAKATHINSKPSRGNIFRFKGKLSAFTFKTSKLKPQPVNREWISAIVEPAVADQSRSGAAAPSEILKKTVFKSESLPPLPKVTTQNVHAILQALRKECHELAKNENHYELQKRIVDILYAVELPTTKKETIWENGEAPDTRYQYTERELLWKTLTGKEQADCGVALSELSELMCESVKKTHTLTPEKTLLFIKSGYIQEYLARLNQQESGLKKEHVLTFWKILLEDTSHKDVILRAYSDREADLQHELKEFYDAIQRADRGFFRHESKKNYTHEAKYELPNGQPVEIKEAFVWQPTYISHSPQLEALEKYMEGFQNLGIGDTVRKKGSSRYADSWNKRSQHTPLKAAAEHAYLGLDFLLPKELYREGYLWDTTFSEQTARNRPKEFLGSPERSLPDISKEDVGDLLIILGNSSVSEMMGLIRKKPYLLEFSSIRSMIDQRLFGKKNLTEQLLAKSIAADPLSFVKRNSELAGLEAMLTDLAKMVNEAASPNPLAYHLATWVKEQTQLFKHQGKVHETLFMMNLSLTLTNLVPELPQEIGKFFDFPDYASDIREWAYASLDPQKPEFAHRHTLWTHLLLLQENASVLTGEQIADFLKGIAILETAPAETYELDPLIQARVNSLKEKWKEPIRQFLANPETVPLVNHVLDSICQFTHLPLPNGELTGKFPVYHSGIYEINILEGIIRDTEGGWISRSIPIPLREHKDIKGAFPSKELQNIVAKNSLQKDKDIFRFSDKHGQANLIVSSGKNATAYKELEIKHPGGSAKTWLQFVKKEELFAIQKKQKQKHVGFISLVWRIIKKAKEENEAPPIPQVLDREGYTFWRNPQKPAQVMVLDIAGESCYQIILKQLKGRAVIAGIIDLRKENADTKFQKIGSLSEKIDPVWQQLTSLDSSHNITVWKSGNRIEKVELNRYGLTFKENEGKAVCTHPRLNGWILDVAPLSLKKGLSNALVLRHPTIASQYRLIVPDRSITPKKSVPKFSYAFIFKVFKSIVGKKLLSIDFKDPVTESWKFGDLSEKQDFWIFDINPVTLNLEETAKESIRPYLQIAQLSYLNNQPETALEMLMQMHRFSKKWTKKDVAALNAFIEFPIKTPDGTALQLHCALLARKLGPKSSKEAFEKATADLYKEYLQFGSKVSPSVKLSPKDELIGLKALEKHSPSYFQAHAPVLVQLHEERRKMQAKQIERPYFQARPEIKQQLENFSDKLIQTLKSKPESSSFDFLARDVSQLGTQFVDLYKVATVESPASQKFKELDLTVRALPHKGGQEAYLKTLQNYLTRVLEIRKEGTKIPFPEFPQLDLADDKWEIEEQNKLTLNQFFQTFEKAVVEAEAARVGNEEEKARVDLAEFDLGLFAKDWEEALKRVKTDGSLDELTIKDLEEARQAKQPKGGTIPLASVGQSLYTAEELKKFFKPMAHKEPVPELDLTDLKNAANPALQAAAQSLDEEIKIAKQEIETTTPMEFLDGEKSRTVLEKDLFSKKKEWHSKQEKAREGVLKLVQAKTSPAYELQQKAKFVKNIDLELLLKHFLQNDLEGLGDHLPAGISYEELKIALGNYLLFATETQRLDAALEEVKTLNTKKEKVSPLAIAGFYTQLTAERQYDPKQAPQLLLFEYMTNLLLRDSQLKMVQDFLQNPNCVRQAVTGAGKTTVILVLLALMQADGTNLVTVNFPKHLFEENLHDLQNKLGRIFQRSVYSLQFNMSTPTVEENGESLFKRMYEDLLKTSLAKGVVISTLESQQALEQKWIHLMDLQSNQPEESIKPIERQHLKYLTKIILFKREHEYSILDEFDKALNQREERHLKVGTTVPIPQHIWKTTLDLYELLLAEPELGLQKNLQGKLLTDAQREAVLDKVAGKVAVEWAQQKGISVQNKELFLKEFTNYLQGKDELLLAKIQHWTPEELDAVAVLKDQFYTFLPLTLAKTCQVRYMRSKDGVHTVPCFASDIPRESSEFDQMLEKINYTIQDYYQTGIKESFIQQWVTSKKRLAEAGVMNGAYVSLDETPEAKVFADYFPGRKLGNLLPSQIPELVQELNRDPKRIRRFLEQSLSKLEVSSGKVSCDGHNLVSMSKHTAGTSATLGSLHALPPSIQTKGAEDKGATGKMVTEMLKKSQNPDGTFPPMQRYHVEDPTHIIPAALRKDADIQAFIDGAADLHGLPFGLASQQLLMHQPSGTKVRGIIQGGEGNRQQVRTTRGIVGLEAAGLKPAELGGFYDESRARGADFKMMPGARAFVTANNHQLFEEALQTAGRLRRPDQRICYATSMDDPLKDAPDLVKQSLKNSVEREADDLYRSKKKDLRDKLRSAMIEDLLQKAQEGGLDAMLNRYREFEKEDILITQKKNDLAQPGAYFAAHAAINRMDKDPVAELNHLRESYLTKAQGLGLKQAVQTLQPLGYSPELVERLPKKVFGASNPLLDQEVEVETETETETQIEVETEIETEIEKSTGKRKYDSWIGYNLLFYLGQLSKGDLEPKGYVGSDMQVIHPAFDEKIHFTENFFPISQNLKKDPAKEIVRQPHDDMQNPANYVVISLDKDGKGVAEAVLIDSLEFATKAFMYILIPSNVYNMRLRRFVEGPLALPGAQIPEAIKPELNKLLAQIRFFNGEYDQYSAEEFAALRVWLEKIQQNTPETDMEKYFKAVILKHKPEAQQNYPFSPLAKLFKELQG